MATSTARLLNHLPSMYSGRVSGVVAMICPTPVWRSRATEPFTT